MEFREIRYPEENKKPEISGFFAIVHNVEG
jgi:hypothetical protein